MATWTLRDKRKDIRTMTKTINNRKNMTTQELEAVSGGVVPWAAISVGIAAAKLTYDLSYAAGKSFYNLTH